MATQPLEKPKGSDQKKPQIVEKRRANDWTTPQAMAIPKGGYFADTVEQGIYGPIFPKTPACYGFSVVAKVIPGREEHLYNHAKTIEKAIAENPTFLAPLKAHYLRWVIFPINGESYMMYQGIFDTDFDKYCEDASVLFGKSGIHSAFEALEGWPKDYATNPASIVKFFREHQCPSFLEYSQHPYVSCDEINKALKLKASFSNMLDQMQ
jgi:hypothetical protein